MIGKYHEIGNNQGQKQDVIQVGDKAKALSQLTQSSSLSKQALVYLSKVQIGDLVKGQLVTEDAQTFLHLENGLKLLATMDQSLPLGQLHDFLVVGKERQHLVLQMSKETVQVSNQSLVQQALEDLGLPQNEQMQAVVEQFLDKGLPLIKNQLVQLGQMSKYFEMPSEPLTNLVAEGQMPHTKELECLQAFKKDGLAMIDQTISKLVDLSNPHQKEVFINALLKQFEPETLLKHVGLLEEMMQPTDKLLAKDALGMRKQLLGQGEGNLPNEVTKGQQGTLGKENLQSKLMMLLEEVPSEPTQIKQLLSHLEPTALKQSLKKMLVDLMAVHLEDLPDPKEMKKLSEGHEALKKLTAALQETTKGAATDEQQHVLHQLEQTCQAFDKYNNQGQYFYFPIQLKENEAKGELYFFQPKRSKKKGNGQGFYMVLALQMPALNQIEIHFKQNASQVQLTLKVQNETICKLLEAHQMDLKALLAETSFQLNTIHCELLDKKEEKSAFTTSSDLTHMDYRI